MLISHYISLILVITLAGCGSNLSDPAHLEATMKLSQRFQHEPVNYLEGKQKQIKKDVLQAYYTELQTLAPAQNSKLRAWFDWACKSAKDELQKNPDPSGFISKE